MIPEMLRNLMNICADLYGRPVRDDFKLRTVIETELWEGFVNDVKDEFGLDNDFTVDPSLKIYQLYRQIVEYQASVNDTTELPEFTLVIHADDKIVNDLLDDLEAVLEKHNMPYAMTAYVPKNGTMEKQPLSRASDEAVFNYHEKVMDMFRGK